MNHITIVDFGAGNLRSVQNAFAYLGFKSKITSDPDLISTSSALVLPGQGSAAPAMSRLKSTKMDLAIKDFINSERPFLGICLGFQLLFDRSEESDTACLGLLPGTVQKFPNTQKVPQIGWNSVEIIQDHSIFDGIPNQSYFYFAHSYYVKPSDTNLILGKTKYGLGFSSVIAQKNIIAAQFHPEKSGEVGLRFYQNFTKKFSLSP